MCTPSCGDLVVGPLLICIGRYSSANRNSRLFLRVFFLEPASGRLFVPTLPYDTDRACRGESSGVCVRRRLHHRFHVVGIAHIEVIAQGCAQHMHGHSSDSNSVSALGVGSITQVGAIAPVCKQSQFENIQNSIAPCVCSPGLSTVHNNVIMVEKKRKTCGASHVHFSRLA